MACTAETPVSCSAAGFRSVTRPSRPRTMTPSSMLASTSAQGGRVPATRGGSSTASGAVLRRNATLEVVLASAARVVGVVAGAAGDALADAQQLLKDAGFESAVQPQDVTDPSQDGLVLAQDPSAGPREQGSTVTLFVGRLVSTPPPDTTTADTTTADTTTTDTTTTAPGFPTPP